jgi:hypothetical protein
MLVWLVLLGCGSEPVAETPAAEAPVRTVPAPQARPTRGGRAEDDTGPLRIEAVRLEPAKPTAADEVHAAVDVGGAGPVPPRLDFTWYVNGLSVPGAITDTLQAGKAKRTDTIRVDVAVHDADPPVKASSDTVTIANQPPVLLTQVHDLGHVDGLILKAEDPDGDPITWRLKGEPAGMSIDPRGVLHYTGSPDEKGGTYTVSILAEDSAHDFVAVDLPLTLTPGSAAVRAEAEAKKAAEAAANEAAAKK